MAIKLPSKEERALGLQKLETYQLALGKVAHAWNHMQEQLGQLFCTVAGLNNSMGMAIWHSLRSDRSQRDLLAAAIAAASRNEHWRNNQPEAHDSIVWILEKVNALADRRNSAVHAPIYADLGNEYELKPMTFWSNPNAAKLRGKDILAEFEWYEGYAHAIAGYVSLIDTVLFQRKTSKPIQWTPWPNRPVLPTVKQKNGRPSRNHPTPTE